MNEPDSLSGRKDEYRDVTGTLRKAQRQVEGLRPKSGLRLLRALEPAHLNSPERLRFYYLRALGHLRRDDPGRAFPDLEEAGDLAQRLHNDGLGARIAALTGWGHTMLHRPGMALQCYAVAREEIEGDAEADEAFARVIYAGLGHAYWALGNPERAIVAYEHAAGLDHYEGDPALVGAIHAGLAQVYSEAGQVAPARTHVLRALQIYAEGGPFPLLSAAARLTFAGILARLADWEEAEQQLRQALSEASADPALQRTIRVALAELAGQQDAATALPIFEQTLAGLPAGTPAALRARLLRGYARSLTGAGQAAAAAGVYEEAARQTGVVDGLAPVGGAPPIPAGFTRTPATNGERRHARALSHHLDGAGPAPFAPRPYLVGARPRA